MKPLKPEPSTIVHVETNLIHADLYCRHINRNGWQYNLVIPKGHKIFTRVQHKHERIRDEQFAEQNRNRITPVTFLDDITKEYKLDWIYAIILDNNSLSPEHLPETSQLPEYVKAIQDSSYAGMLMVTYFEEDRRLVMGKLADRSVNLDRVTFLSKPHTLTDLINALEETTVGNTNPGKTSGTATQPTY